ncbi:MAG: LysR family transcriptional regulator [Streptosporangiales bacterium]|nr:LysR family transcriptional regulator [Streptosporangiales bacterium]
MEWREIEVFLTLADELHFGRTADRLYLSQARVSQTVRALESRVGGRLFERTSRQVSLTPLGERLRDELRPGYEQILRAFAAARERTRGVAGTLRIGVMSLLVGGPHLNRILRRFEEAHPMCKVSVVDATASTCMDQVRDGQLDLVATYLPLTAPELTIGPVLARQERALLVPDDHPLARRGYADAEDLADVVMCYWPEVPDETRDVWIPARTPSGLPTRRIVLDASHGTVTLLSAIARGTICHPTVTAFGQYFHQPGVTLIPLHGIPPLESALVWNTNRETAAVRAFVKCATEILADDAGGGSAET